MPSNTSDHIPAPPARQQHTHEASDNIITHAALRQSHTLVVDNGDSNDSIVSSSCRAPFVLPSSPRIRNKQRKRLAAAASTIAPPSTLVIRGSTTNDVAATNAQLPSMVSGGDARPAKRRLVLPRSRVNLSKQPMFARPSTVVDDDDDNEDGDAAAAAAAAVAASNFVVLDHRVKANCCYFEYLIRWHNVSKRDQWLPVTELDDTRPVSEYRNPCASRQVVGFINYAPQDVTRLDEQFVTPMPVHR